MGKKVKQVYRKKEEILADLKKNEDFQRRMKFVKESFYPALCKASKNIEDAQMFVGSITTVMMEIFLGFMKEKKLSELNLILKLDEKDEKYEDLCEMMKLFDNMSVFEAREHFESMKREIDLFLREETRKRPLGELTVNWML